MPGIENANPFAYVSTETIPQSPPPTAEKGVAGWLKKNLFATPRDTVLTIIVALILLWLVPPMLNWLFFDAVWTGDGREACLGEHVGACWAFVEAKFGQFMYGRYPVELRWRVDLTGILLIAGLVPIAIPSVPYKRENALYLLVIFPVVAFMLLTGWPFLEPVETTRWGGLLVTLVVAIVGIVVSFPLGILLALGRRSNLPIVKTMSIIFIEFWRGVPLITVLFMSSVMLPLFLPADVSFDKLLRALIGVALFSSAYMAEVIRGGLQAIPKGQYEAANAMALTFWQGMRLIILPQALKLVIPGIVNTFIGLFKDTTLVVFIGLLDPIGLSNAIRASTDWNGIYWELFVFIGLCFFIFCFSMGRYSLFLEKKLRREHR